jgi:type IV pilus assembly protein PilX
MNVTTRPNRKPPGGGRHAQSGVIMLIVLVSLVALLAAGIALIRSANVGLLQAGNIAFKRDLQNEAEQGIKTAITRLNSGALKSESARLADIPSINYSASKLASDATRGIPAIMLNDTAFAASGMTGAETTDSATGVKLLTVIDRQCYASGTYSNSSCVSRDVLSSSLTVSKSTQSTQAAAPEAPIYRITVRATGPRNTQFFMQATVVR